MAFISYVPDDRAPPELKELYDRYGSGGNLDNILRIHSQHPRSMETHFELYHCLMWESGPLSRAQREMIAVTVSSINRCFY